MIDLKQKHHLAYMDDCLVHSKKKDHLYHIVALLKALIKHGLKNFTQEMCSISEQVSLIWDIH